MGISERMRASLEKLGSHLLQTSGQAKVWSDQFIVELWQETGRDSDVFAAKSHGQYLKLSRLEFNPLSDRKQPLARYVALSAMYVKLPHCHWLCQPNLIEIAAQFPKVYPLVSPYCKVDSKNRVPSQLWPIILLSDTATSECAQNGLQGYASGTQHESYQKDNSHFTQSQAFLRFSHNTCYPLLETFPILTPLFCSIYISWALIIRRR